MGKGDYIDVSSGKDEIDIPSSMYNEIKDISALQKTLEFYKLA